jgi:hypothetical protein
VLAGVAGVALALTGAGWAAPAAADPAGLETVVASLAVSSVDKGTTAACPTGKVVSGGGAFPHTALAAEGRIGLDRLEPLANGSGFVGTIREVGPTNYAGDWGLQVLAQCVPAPAGYQVVSTTGAAGTEYVTASCGTKKVIGTGGRINSGSGDVVLDQLVPSFDLSSVTVRGVPVQGTSPTGWSVTAFAVCATGPAGLERVALTGSNASDQQKTRVLTCPAGKALYGVGADISAGNGQVLLTGVNITGTNTLRAWANEDADGYAGAWSFNGYGICGS